MKLKKRLIGIFSIVLAVLLVYIGIPSTSKVVTGEKPPTNETPDVQRTLPGEQFIRSRMINETGTLRTYLKPARSTSKSIAAGHDALSESMGLWMQYAFEKGDQTLFRQNAEIVKTQFMKPDGWVAWMVSANNQEVATNALVDDLRIASVLYDAAARWNDADFKATADTIAKSIVKKQVVNGTFRDFYDYPKKWTSSVITLSYLSGSAITDLYEKNQLGKELFEKTKTFVVELPLQNGFYPFNYNYDKGKFEFHDQVNLLDQLFIEYSRVQFGQKGSPFWEFLKTTFQRDRMLMGQYKAATQEKAVGYESPSVYGLAVLCALEYGDNELAKDLYYRMIRMQTLNPDSEYYGGYIDYQTADTHIFDNLVPLLAERKLYNARILQ